MDPEGDLSCLAGSLVTESPGSGCVRERTMLGTVMDFQDGSPVREASVEIFLADGIFGVPDHAFLSDSSLYKALLSDGFTNWDAMRDAIKATFPASLIIYPLSMMMSRSLRSLLKELFTFDICC